jgi:hypothetical protein
VKLERIVLYDRARPYASREVVLGDEFTGRLNHDLDDFERATSDRDRNSARSQFAPGEIDLPLAQLIHQSSAERAHSSPLFRISHVPSEYCGAQATKTGSVAGRQPLLRRALRSPDRFPDKASQFLRNIQDCFKELLRITRIEHRPRVAYRTEIFHSVDIPSPKPRGFSQTRRVESASSRRSHE